MKRVLFLTSSYPSSANPVNGIFIADLAKAVAQTTPVSVIAPALPGVPLREEHDGVRVYRFPQSWFGVSLAGEPGGMLPALKRHKWLLFFLPLFCWSALRLLHQVVRQEKIEVIHAHWVIPMGVLTALYKSTMHKPLRLIITCHGSDLMKVSGWLMGRVKAFALRRADLVTMVSPAMPKKLIEIGCTTSTKIAPMGIDCERFCPEAPGANEIRRRNRIPAEARLLLFVGSLIELKGVRALVSAMPEILRQTPDAHLLLAGGGELTGAMGVLAEELQVSERVHFAGSVPHEQLPAYFAAADLFLLPSFSEGMPMVMMEALATGLPIVLSQLPGVVLLPDAERLFSYCEAGNSASIAAAVAEALKRDSAEQRAFARNYAICYFALSEVAERYLRCYFPKRQYYEIEP